MKRWCVICSEQVASVYCRNDDAYLCKGCDETIHSSNALAARHERVKICELCSDAMATVHCQNDSAYLCDACDASVHSNPVTANHKRTSVAGCCLDPPAVTSQTVEATPTAEAPAPAPGPAQAPPAAAAPAPSVSMGMDGLVPTMSNGRRASPDGGADSFSDLQVPGLEHSGRPPVADLLPTWGDLCQLDAEKGSSKIDFLKELDMPDMEPAWLDRLDMGFDYDDLLLDFDEGESTANLLTDSTKKAALPSSPKAATCDSSCSNSLLSKEAASVEVETNQPTEVARPATAQVPVAPTTSTPIPTLAASFAAPMPNVLDPTFMQFQTGYALPLAEALQLVQQAKTRMPTNAASQPPLDRAARVARYREKRKHRKFRKTIRYQSRKAYAEIRPRIKGRFATKDEVAAMKAAEAAKLAQSMPRPLMCEDDAQVVPEAFA